MNLTSAAAIKRLMAQHGLHFNKSLGQNFLLDENVLDKIVRSAEISSEDTVLEIGPGLGGMTQRLCAAAGWVIAVEIDRGLVGVLREIFKDTENIEIIHGDILKMNIRDLVGDKKVKVIANLPYYITTPIIMRLLEEETRIQSITVMVQKEVADRMTAPPGGKEYGALSVAVQYHSHPEIVGIVPKGAFMPPPKVESAVVNMRTLEEKAVKTDPERFFRLVKASFGQRRKTLVNALYGSHFYEMSKEELKNAVIEVELDEMVRAERLTISQFAALAEKIR